MSIVRNITRAIRMTLVFWVLTAIVYPLLILAVGQVAFPFQAKGSMMQNIEGQPIGSTLIGQQFRTDRYFHGRPSTIRYSQGKQAKPTGISGASNLAPSNPDLLSRIVEQANTLKDENIKPPADLVYTSGSGLDPHISVEAAEEQLDRVARARSVQPDEIKPLIDRYTDGRFLGIFGEPGVNVLRLNYALDLKEQNRKQNQ
ncbi:MAG: K(+)-transporting ATPase subunit C [Cyanomargarita calcarea GSE-NOS-MK-12-04C]|uniref:Potassium-transporting ATPase KdpC subunit n=1 Tax=Cyanomargarita calcarea GSE-NOS-MK-12-04C TaxID=2839659 RepID=A0A951QR36_9CYAN|nr:K(+)-transporting ATPase subunit C [Cyanomargarita calcarea GSE-NOS-MK-12-04C]